MCLRLTSRKNHHTIFIRAESAHYLSAAPPYMMWRLCLAAPTLAQIARMVSCGTTRCRFITHLKKGAATVDTALVSLFAGSNLRRRQMRDVLQHSPGRASILRDSN